MQREALLVFWHQKSLHYGLIMDQNSENKILLKTWTFIYDFLIGRHKLPSRSPPPISSPPKSSPNKSSPNKKPPNQKVPRPRSPRPKGPLPKAPQPKSSLPKSPVPKSSPALKLPLQKSKSRKRTLTSPAELSYARSCLGKSIEISNWI